MSPQGDAGGDSNSDHRDPEIREPVLSRQRPFAEASPGSSTSLPGPCLFPGDISSPPPAGGAPTGAPVRLCLFPGDISSPLSAGGAPTGAVGRVSYPAISRQLLPQAGSLPVPLSVFSARQHKVSSSQYSLISMNAARVVSPAGVLGANRKYWLPATGYFGPCRPSVFSAPATSRRLLPQAGPLPVPLSVFVSPGRRRRS